MDVFLTSSDGIWVLCERLRAERLLVNSEVGLVDSLRNLLVDVENKLLNLGLISWNNKQHQLLLQRLLSSHAIVSPDTACSIATQLNAVQVTEAYRRLGHHHSAISRILSILLGSPRTTAELLHAVDSIQTISSEDAIHSIFSLVYGNGVVPSDEKKLLEVRINVKKDLLKYVIFLTAALHDSVMLVLCQDEIFLDIDPSKATLICTDLIVTNLLCPAIANPENVGVISDTPISHIARFNLMQIGQIIQTLSLSHHESPPPHFQVFTNQFKESPICGLVPTLLSRPLKSLDSIFPTVLNESNKPREIFHRTHFMASMIEVNTLMAILHSEAPSSISSERVKNEITSLSRRLPHSFSTNGNNEREVVKSNDPSPSHLPRQSRLRNFAGKVGSAVSDRTTDNASDLEEEAEQQEVGSISSSMEAPQEDRMLLLDEDGASTLPDNVSDVDVGGMSGRGSPSLSGRDSPLSQAPSQSNRETEGTEHGHLTKAADLGAVSTTASASVDVAQRNLPRGVPVAVRKQNAEGLEEKFGKFTVPTSDQNRSYRYPYFLGDDQRSLLSDSWSTNVVPSDDEGPTPPGPALLQLIHLPPGDQSEVSGIPRTGRVVNRTGSLGGGGVVFEDRSDTWSLDAIASDSEADGGRERERQVQDVQDDVHQREQDDVDSSRVTDRVILLHYHLFLKL
uniref:Ras-GAP domain-containing protein n=1 Tax=Heterorhabditis bacteriophora TaxID=37862 RepID=A0A1I7X4E4_HETBA